MAIEGGPGHRTAVFVIGHRGAGVPREVAALAPAMVLPADGDRPLERCVADLPAQVDVVAVCEANGDQATVDLGAVLDGLGDADACVCARPVTDAVKVVHAGRVVGSVDRAHLTHVGLPVALRRRVVTGAAAQVALRDVAALTARLLGRDSRVRMVGATPRHPTGAAS